MCRNVCFNVHICSGERERERAKVIERNGKNWKRQTRYYFRMSSHHWNILAEEWWYHLVWSDNGRASVHPTLHSTLRTISCHEQFAKSFRCRFIRCSVYWWHSSFWFSPLIYLLCSIYDWFLSQNTTRLVRFFVCLHFYILSWFWNFHCMFVTVNFVQI